MTVYSKETNDIIERIFEYYEENDSFQFLQKMQRFIIEGIGYIDEQYLVLSKENIQYFIDEAVKIWEDDGNAEKLNELRKQYSREYNEFKSFRTIPVNKEKKEKEDDAQGCMLTVLYNGHDDPVNQFVHDFLEIYIARMERLNVAEDIIQRLLKKYFSEIL